MITSFHWGQVFSNGIFFWIADLVLTFLSSFYALRIPPPIVPLCSLWLIVTYLLSTILCFHFLPFSSSLHLLKSPTSSTFLSFFIIPFICLTKTTHTNLSLLVFSHLSHCNNISTFHIITTASFLVPCYLWVMRKWRYSNVPLLSSNTCYYD